jgi:hypothetical protein
MEKFVLSLLIFISVLFLVVPGTAVVNVIAQGGDVFIGEQGLDVSAATGGYAQMAWFAAGTNPDVDTPDFLISVGDPRNFYVAPVNFVGKTGNWYRWDGNTHGIVFDVNDPAIALKIWDQNSQKDVSGKLVNSGNMENFRVESNLYTISSRPGYNPQTDGQFTIKVRNPSGTVYTALYQTASLPIVLTGINLNVQPFYWVSTGPLTGQPVPYAGWNTGLLTNQGMRIYPPGVYTAWAECNVNGMKDNYKDPGGNDYTGKTVAATTTVTIAEPTTPTPIPTIPSISYDLHLYPGWNFISTPRTLVNGENTALQVFQSVNTAAHSVFTYDASSNAWKSYTGSDIVKPLDGIWIYSTDNIILALKLNPDPLQTPPVKALSPGWNAIGFSDISPATARDTLSSIQDSWSILIGYDASSGKYDTSIIKDGSGTHSDTQNMNPTKGYWIYLNRAGDLAAIGA